MHGEHGQIQMWTVLHMAKSKSASCDWWRMQTKRIIRGDVGWKEQGFERLVQLVEMRLEFIVYHVSDLHYNR